MNIKVNSKASLLEATHNKNLTMKSYSSGILKGSLSRTYFWKVSKTINKTKGSNSPTNISLK